jgi:cysteine synthase
MLKESGEAESVFVVVGLGTGGSLIKINKDLKGIKISVKIVVINIAKNTTWRNENIFYNSKKDIA